MPKQRSADNQTLPRFARHSAASRIAPRSVARALLLALLFAPSAVLLAQAPSQNPPVPLPDQPQPKLVVHQKSKLGPCRVLSSERQAGDAMASNAANQALDHAGLELIPHGRQSSELQEAADLPPLPPATHH